MHSPPIVVTTARGVSRTPSALLAHTSHQLDASVVTGVVVVLVLGLWGGALCALVTHMDP